MCVQLELHLLHYFPVLIHVKETTQKVILANEYV